MSYGLELLKSPMFVSNCLENSKLELNMADRSFKIAKLNKSYAVNEGLSAMLKTYAAAGLAKSTHKYQKEAVQRALKRLKLILGGL